MTTTTTEMLVLPLDLAPMLVERIRQLLAEVQTAVVPPTKAKRSYAGPRCVVCHQGGKLGRHHDADGVIEWIHRSCHRRLHRRGHGTGHRGRRRTTC